MADNKKYYYMRLKENFFETEEMVMLEAMPDGFLYSNILIKLYLKSLKYEGRLLFKDTIPYNSQMIATITRHPVGVVEKALQVFKELELITLLDGNVLYMSEIEMLVGKTSTEADRKRAVRKRIESGEMPGLLETNTGSGQMSGQMSDKSTPEIRDKSIEIKDKSIESREENEVANAPTSPPPATSPLIDMNYMKIKQHFEQQVIYQQATFEQNKQLVDLVDDYKDPNLIIEAMKIAVERSVPKIAYINGILKGWRTDGITNLKQLTQDGGKQNAKNGQPVSSHDGKTPEEIELMERLRTYSS